MKLIKLEHFFFNELLKDYHTKEFAVSLQFWINSWEDLTIIAEEHIIIFNQRTTRFDTFKECISRPMILIYAYDFYRLRWFPYCKSIENSILPQRNHRINSIKNTDIHTFLKQDVFKNINKEWAKLDIKNITEQIKNKNLAEEAYYNNSSQKLQAIESFTLALHEFCTRNQFSSLRGKIGAISAYSSELDSNISLEDFEEIKFLRKLYLGDS